MIPRLGKKSVRSTPPTRALGNLEMTVEYSPWLGLFKMGGVLRESSLRCGVVVGRLFGGLVGWKEGCCELGANLGW